MMVNKKFWAATFTLSGSMIGAGILGLPYVFAKAGFLAGFFWMIFLGVIIVYVNLCLGEITLRTKGKHQLAGYGKKYLGVWGKRIMFFAVIFGVYSALVAYLIGEGKSLSIIFPGNINPLILGFSFWFIMTILLRGGTRELKRVGTYSVLIILTIIIGTFVWFFGDISLENLGTFSGSNFFLPIGVVLFSLLGFVSIPELRNVIKGDEKLMKKAIFFGTVIPIILYLIFCVIFIGKLGKDVSEVATLSLGPFVTLLGVFTMLSAFFILSLSLKHMFRYDLKYSEKTNFILSSVIPLLIYFFTQGVDIFGFSKILGIGGVISGGLTGIMILIINHKAKKFGDRKSEIKMPLGKIIIVIVSLLFIVGVVLEFLK
jgi:tyrosine-specific transport protein